MATQLQLLSKKLDRVEKELQKVRGCSSLQDGWQTQRFANKSRKWDVLSLEKFELIKKIEDLKCITKNK